MSDLSGRLAALTPEQRALLSARLGGAPARPASVPIAIIGMGCRFPGGANSPEAFWKNLCAGVNAVRTIPSDRWDAERYFSSDTSVPAKTNSRWGAFLDQVDQFDREFFGLSPREAMHMDPQQRLLLETCWEALEDAGQMTEALAGSAAGVFVGVQNGSSDYLAMQFRDRQRLDTYTATGASHSILANRLSFLLDLRGPSLAVDTACSSSLVAVHMACQSLRLHECDLAIAGGVNLILTPDGHIALGKLEMMAPDGRCKTFDHRADGFVRGEGCGVVILKRLADALSDKDPVLAVILGSVVNQNGAGNGLTAPNGLAQEVAIRRAMEMAQIPPEKIGFVETHGTGTALGDPVELEALANVLATAGRETCALGAVKTNLGHLEGASGMAGLIKTVLCLQHSSIPPNLNFEKLNPHITLAGTPFVLPSKQLEWPVAAEPRVAGVSSFGFGGTNAHVVVSSSPASAARAATESSSALLLPISARSGPALHALAESYIDFLRNGVGATTPAADIAYTASLRRRHHDFRWCVAGRGADDWAAALDEKLALNAPPSPIIDNAAAGIVFAYCDQGTQWPQMGNQLAKTEQVFRDTLEQCDVLFRQHAPWSVLTELTAPAVRSGLNGTEIAQAAIFTLQVALTQLWRSLGIEPAAVVGRGVGEVAAAHAAGVLSLPNAVRVVFHRGRLMQRQLTVDGAVGSPLMDAGEVELRLALRGLTLNKPRTQIMSTVSGRIAGPDDFGPEYWARNIMQPAHIATAVQALLAEGRQVFVEIGPHRALYPVIGQAKNTADSPVTITPSLQPDQDERYSLLESAAALHAAGCSINWRHFFPGNYRCVQLPRYPWQRQRYWLPPLPETHRATDDSLQATQAISDTPPSHWFYEVAWEPRSSLTRGATQSSPLKMVDLRRTLTVLSRRVPEVYRDTRCDTLEDLPELLTQQIAGFIWAALADLGIRTSIGSHLPKVGLDRQLKLLPRFERLTTSLLEILASADVLRDDGDHFTVVRPPPLKPASENEQLLARFSEARELLLLVNRCGPRLGDVLRGNCDPLSLLFTQETKSSSQAIYRDAAPSQLANRITAEAVQDWIGKLPSTRTLRVLEIGAGTGGTTAALLPLLPADRCEYLFTDISPLFLKRAAENFASYSFVRFELLDLERSPAEQGFSGGHFDLVVAANVLHATCDLSVSLEHTRQLLAPGGLLLLMECTSPRPWLDITFGLTEGWWRFTDTALRTSHPLMNEKAWVELLGKVGFADADALPLQESDTALIDQALIFARNSPARTKGVGSAAAKVLQDAALLHTAMPAPRSPAKYLIFADPAGVADALKRRLETRGDVAHLVRHGPSFARAAANEFSASLDSLDDLRHVFASVGPDCRAVVYFGSDHDPSHPADSAAEELTVEDLVQAVERPLRLVQTLLATGFSPSDGLWIATRGSQALSRSAPTRLSQALLWGLGRGVALEAPQLRPRLLDLDPLDLPDRAAGSLLTEMDDPNVEDQIALRHEQRYVARLKRSADMPPAPDEVDLPLSVSGAHLITGGLGELGAQLALRLAAAGAAHLLLVVKRPLPERDRWDNLWPDDPDVRRVHIVRQLQATGTKVTVAPIDLADESSLTRWFASLDLTTLPLRGVWHTAASISPSPIGQLGSHAVREMITVKSHAAWRLHQLTQTLQLDYFVLFSSTTALWGASELAHYAAANAYLDGLAHFRRHAGLPATVINWGLWRQIDGLANAQRNSAARFGLRSMPPAAALLAMQHVLTADLCQSVVADIDWSIFKPLYESRRQRPFLERISELPANPPASQIGNPQLLIDWLEAAAADERREILSKHVQNLLAAVLGTGAEESIDREKGFFELGMDSLTSVQLRRRLEHDLRRPLPSTLAFNYSTIDLLTDYLHRELFPDAQKYAARPSRLPASPPVVVAPMSTPGAHDDADATEDELFDQLAARLAQT